MAVRINGTGQFFQRTTGLPTSGAISACGWCHYIASRSAFAYLFALENAAASATNWYTLGWTSANTFELESQGASGVVGSFSVQPAPGRVFVWGVVASGTGAGQLIAYWRYPEDKKWNATGTVTGRSFTTAALTIGNDSFDEWTNAAHSRVKVWGRILRADQLLRESQSLQLLDPTAVTFYWPMRDPGDFRDLGGRGHPPGRGGAPLGHRDYFALKGPHRDLTLQWPIAGGGNVYNLSATDSITAGDSATSVGTFAATASDAATTTDAATSTGTFGATASDAASASDASTTQLVAGASASDSISATDAATSQAAFAAAATDSATASDASTAQLTKAASASDAVTATDAATIANVVAAAATDSVSTTDSASSSVVTASAASDSVTATDASTALPAFAVTASDSVTSTDASTALVVLAASASDSVAASDASTTQEVVSAAATDAASASDAATVQLSGSVAASDSVSASDASTAQLTGQLAAADAVTATDSSSTTGAFAADATDAVNASDTADDILVMSVSASDSVTSTDSALSAIVVAGGISDQHAKWLEALTRVHGLIDPLQVSTTSRSDGTLQQDLAAAGGVTTVTPISVPTGVPSSSALTPTQAAWLEALARAHGLIDPLTVDSGGRTDGTLTQTISEAGGTVTLTRT